MQFLKRLLKRVHMFRRHHWQDGDLMRLLGETGPTTLAYDEALMKDAKFDLKIEATTTLPYDRERRINEADTLFGAVPTQTTLRKSLEARDMDADDIELIVAEWLGMQMAEAIGESEGGEGGGEFGGGETGPPETAAMENAPTPEAMTAP